MLIKINPDLSNLKIGDIITWMQLLQDQPPGYEEVIHVLPTGACVTLDNEGEYRLLRGVKEGRISAFLYRGPMEDLQKEILQETMRFLHLRHQECRERLKQL